MKAYVFPGQGSQFSGMGLSLYNDNVIAKHYFELADKILDFSISKVMFYGSEEDLKQTKITQPAIFLHSTILIETIRKQFHPDMVAGHSLGEFSALVANKTLSFEDGLKLVYQRAMAMQQACELHNTTMVAVVGRNLLINKVEEICSQATECVVVANYNAPSQIVISGSVNGIDSIIDRFTDEANAKHIVRLNVGGAFHSPFMETARTRLAKDIEDTPFSQPICPIYQNCTGKASTDITLIKQNLINQLTSPVLWTQSVSNMIADGADQFIEVGPGKVLQGLVQKIDADVYTEGIV